MSGSDAVFLASAGLAAASSFLAVTRRSPIYSAVWMLGALLGVGLIFLLLHSTFLFVVQVLLYAGAILVLFVFVVMLLNPSRADLAKEGEAPLAARGLGALFALAVAGALLSALGASPLAGVEPFSAAAPAVPADFGTTAWVGANLYPKYVLAFEMISVLILVAIAAAILLAKRDLEPGGHPGIGERPAAPRARAGAPAAEREGR